MLDHEIEQQLDYQIVRLAYKLFLNREPENPGVVEGKVKRNASLGALRDEFLNCAEFYKKNMRPLMPTIINKPFRVAPVQCDLEVTDAQLERLIAHIQSVWSNLGETQPHYSVVSNPRFRPDNINNTLDDFKATGEGAASFIDICCANVGCDRSTFTDCLELGCGVGRVTVALSKRFEKVYAVDISPSHLALCREYLAEEKIKNVETFQKTPALENSYPEHDLFYSVLVFQHNPPPVMRLMLQQCLQKLRPGGLAIFQLPTHVDNYSFEIEEYLGKLGELKNKELHVMPQHEVLKLVHNSGCFPLNVHRDCRLSGMHCISTLFVVQKTA